MSQGAGGAGSELGGGDEYGCAVFNYGTIATLANSGTIGGGTGGNGGATAAAAARG